MTAMTQRREQANLRSDVFERITRCFPVLLAAVLLCPIVAAQSNAPRFEVASVKLHTPGAGVNLDNCSGDHFTAKGPVFGNILQFAFDLQGDAGRQFLQQVPASIRENSYDIEAKAAGPMTKSQCQLMLRALIEERFNLKFHMEPREMQLSELVVARGGAKLKQALPTDAGTDINIVINGRVTYTEAPIADAATRASTKGLTMAELAQRLPTTAALRVQDRTGLEGRYNIDLRYSTVLTTDQAATDPPLESALAALGLRLQTNKGTVQVPVLDHIEPPTDN